MMQQSGQERAHVLDLRDRTPARCLIALRGYAVDKPLIHCEGAATLPNCNRRLRR